MSITKNQKIKRVGAPNFSEEVKSILFHCLTKKKHSIENKKTDAFSNKDKFDAWDKITEDFNTNLNVNKVRIFAFYKIFKLF